MYKMFKNKRETETHSLDEKLALFSHHVRSGESCGTLGYADLFCNHPSYWSQCPSRNVTGPGVCGSKVSGSGYSLSSSSFG